MPKFKVYIPNLLNYPIIGTSNISLSNDDTLTITGYDTAQSNAIVDGNNISDSNIAIQFVSQSGEFYIGFLYFNNNKQLSHNGEHSTSVDGSNYSFSDYGIFYNLNISVEDIVKLNIYSGLSYDSAINYDQITEQDVINADGVLILTLYAFGNYWSINNGVSSSIYNIHSAKLQSIAGQPVAITTDSVITLSDGNEINIIIDDLSSDNIEVFYTHSDGLNTIGFLEYNGGWNGDGGIQESTHTFYDLGISVSDIITIRIYNNDEYDGTPQPFEQDNGYTEETVSALLPILCEIRAVNGNWICYEEFPADDGMFNCYIADINAGQSVPISTGGSISLANGDILNISEEDALLDNWTTYDEGYYGLGIALASGNHMSAFLINPSEETSFQSGFNCFFDLGFDIYEEGNIIKIYDTGVDLYESLDEGSDDIDSEQALSAQVPLIAVIVSDGTNWNLSTSNKYWGTEFTINNETLYVSGISIPEENQNIGLYFTRTSGNSSVGYYIRNNNILAQTGFDWLGVCSIPQENDELHIYDGDVYDLEWEGDPDYLDEQTVSEQFNLLAALKVVNGNWTLIE